MVQFIIDIVYCIHRINEEINTNLQIRIVINTSDPIVAGVIGTEKHIFETLGSPILMAQQIEQNGVPMKVHISSLTYELISKSDLNVRERGQIIIKAGEVYTYQVDT